MHSMGSSKAENVRPFEILDESEILPAFMMRGSYLPDATVSENARTSCLPDLVYRLHSKVNGADPVLF